MALQVDHDESQSPGAGYMVWYTWYHDRFLFRYVIFELPNMWQTTEEAGKDQGICVLLEVNGWMESQLNFPFPTPRTGFLYQGVMHPKHDTTPEEAYDKLSHYHRAKHHFHKGKVS